MLSTLYFPHSVISNFLISGNELEVVPVKTKNISQVQHRRYGSPRKFSKLPGKETETESILMTRQSMPSRTQATLLLGLNSSSLPTPSPLFLHLQGFNPHGWLLQIEQDRKETDRDYRTEVSWVEHTHGKAALTTPTVLGTEKNSQCIWKSILFIKRKFSQGQNSCPSSQFICSNFESWIIQIAHLF